jgi:thiamine biosynthesis lipoprotein
MRKVEIIMGMPVSIDIPMESSLDTFNKVFDFLREVDQQFSPYIDSSEVSLFSRGVLKESELSPELLFIMEQCKKYEKVTDGYFSAYYSDSFDPSGYVKAWAIEESGKILTNLGIETFLINIAGDMIARGNIRKWNLAVQDPFSKQSILGTVQLTNRSIATSGSYVRGSHIFDPHTKTNLTDLISVTIYGKDIIKSDVFATACTAMGFDKSRKFLKKNPDYSALLIKNSGESLLVNDFQLNTRTQIAL